MSKVGLKNYSFDKIRRFIEENRFQVACSPFVTKPTTRSNNVRLWVTPLSVKDRTVKLWIRAYDRSDRNYRPSIEVMGPIVGLDTLRDEATDFLLEHVPNLDVMVAIKEL